MLLTAMASLAPEGMQIDIAEIGNLPLYNSDDESTFPAVAQALKDKIEKADGIIIATPEYNRSISGVLKNAIDWASRPYGKNSFAKKPILIAGVSSGKLGTAIAQSHLKQILIHLDASVIGQPEIHLGPAKEIFSVGGGSASDGDEVVISDSTKELLVKSLSVLAGRVGGTV